jgi:hypothetical protein
MGITCPDWDKRSKSLEPTVRPQSAAHRHSATGATRQRRRMALRVTSPLLPPGGGLRLGATWSSPTSRRASPGRAPLPDQPLRADVRRDHRVQPGARSTALQQAARVPTPYPVNPAGFVIHSASTRRARTRLRAAHPQPRGRRRQRAEGRAAADQPAGASVIMASLAYHDYEGIALNDDEKPRCRPDLGHANYLMLRNHGLLTVGRSIPTRSLHMYFFESACRIQVDALAGGAGAEPDRPEGPLRPMPTWANRHRRSGRACWPGRRCCASWAQS